MSGRFVLTEDGGIRLSGEAVDKLLTASSGDAALLYLHILSRGGRFDREDAMRTLHRSEQQMDDAMAVLTRLGLVTGDAPAREPLQRPEEPPVRTAREIEEIIESDKSFRQLVTAVQRDLGAQLSSEGLRTLIDIYSYLRLPPDVIMALVTWCREEYSRRYGEGRVPSMRYIEREAYVWEREGIFSWEAAEQYILGLRRMRDGERELTPVLGISGRALSATERRYINAWTRMGFHAEAVAMAYDRTVVKTGRLTWRYMDSILQSWHSKGLHTPDEIAAGDAPPAYRKVEPAPDRSGGDPGRVTAQELENMRAAIRRMKGESQ